MSDRETIPRAGIKRFGRSCEAAVFTSCLMFFLCALAVLPYPGIQYDEALFTSPLFEPKWDIGGVFLSHFRVPFMLMTYVGCLKSWLYKPIFWVWSPSIYSIRIPVVLIGTASIYLFWVLLRHTVGDRAASVGAILLATDSIFLLTTCFDWGPVALQHLLMIAGMVALVYFFKKQSETFLGLGFFLFGLGLWDKALFFWLMAGLACATLIVFPRELKNLLNWRRLIIAGVLFTLGAFPLVWYNVQHDGITFRGNTKFSLQDLNLKIAALNHTLDGSALFGYMVGDDASHERAPRSLFERLAVGLNRETGEHLRSYMEFALIAALAALPLLWRTPARKPMLFALIFMVVVWAQMAVTIGAGTGAHHVVLMWPFPMFFIATALAELSRRIHGGRIVMVALVILFAGTNIIVTNQYLARFIEFGPTGGWDDAIFPLATYLQTNSTDDIYTADWGIFNSLRVLDRGILRIHEVCFTLEKPTWDESDKEVLSEMLSKKNHLVIVHTDPFEAFSAINARLESAVNKYSYTEKLVATIDDGNGHAVFELLRFEQSVR